MAVAPAPRPPAKPSHPWRSTLNVLVAAALVGIAVPVAAHHVQTTTTGAPFSAQFVHGGDNEWWVEFEARAVEGTIDFGQVQVEGSPALHGMDAVANTAERQRQGWLKFAPEQAFQVPPGKRVMFWAAMSDAAGNKDTVLSCWFTHPAGVEQCDGASSTSTTTSSTATTTSSSSTTSGSASFDAAFTGFRGNEWWVQADVATNGPAIAKVEVRTLADCGDAVCASAFQPLAKQSWGANAYAASYRFPQGSVLQMRATASDGRTDLSSCRQWIPPSGQDAQAVACPTGGAQPGTFDATFTGVKGNEWWVQAQVATNGPAIAKVDVRLATNGAWGGWMPMGKQSWGWGSSHHVPQRTIVQLRATATDGQTDLSSCREWVPPSGQDAAIVTCPGSTVAPMDATFSSVKGNEWWVQVSVAANKPIAAVSFRVDCTPYWTELPKQSWGGYAASYHIPTGSKVDFQARSTDRDSEASGGYLWPSASPASGCPQGDWPRQGSFVEYSLSSSVCGGGECEHASATFRDMYDTGRWLATCDGEDRKSFPDGSSTRTPWHGTNVGLHPSWLTPRTQVGAQVRPDMFQVHFGHPGCGVGWTSSFLTVQRQEDTQMHQLQMKDDAGNPVTLRTWYAESDGADGDNIYTAHWDAKVGLVLDIHSNPRMSGQGSASMVLLDTNAPLR